LGLGLRRGLQATRIACVRCDVVKRVGLGLGLRWEVG